MILESPKMVQGYHLPLWNGEFEYSGDVIVIDRGTVLRPLAIEDGFGPSAFEVMSGPFDGARFMKGHYTF